MFKVETPRGSRAFKVFDPKFLEGGTGPAERKRLDLQKKLIGHPCPYLVTVYSVEEAEGTAFVEMEFCPWPQLSKCLSQIPDNEVPTLISQLVTAVRFLEGLNIVHRDIKPENIHVSPNFKTIKVLDLGVARVFEATESDDSAITDRQNLRPFLATAQYSSPEYLFRLDEPTPRLWKGLNIYQVGAVLHDLVMKSALFQDEVIRAALKAARCYNLTEETSMPAATQVIHSDPEILGGTPVFIGTRVPFRNLIDYLEGGYSLDEFLDSFPSVSRENAVAALEAAHEILSDRADSA